MKKEDFRHKIARGMYNYLLFFLLAAFLAACSMVLFVTILKETMELQLMRENIGMAAKLTFGDVIFLSADEKLNDLLHE